MSLVIIWALLAALTRGRWVPLLMALLSFPILIAIWSIAFVIDEDEPLEF